MKLCCQLKKTCLFSLPTTLGRGWEETRLQNRHPEIPKRKGNEVMPSTPSAGTGVLPPPPSNTTRVVKPTRKTRKTQRPVWTHRQVPKAPLPPADSDITHTCAVVSGKMEQFARWADQPGPSGFGESAPEHAEGSSPPDLSIALPDPLHTAAVYHHAHISLAAASRTKRVLMFSSQPKELRLRKQLNKTKRQARQTTLQHFQQLDPHSHPQTWTQEH